MTTNDRGRPDRCAEARASSSAWKTPVVRRVRSLLSPGKSRHAADAGIGDCVQAAVAMFSTLRHAGLPAGRLWIALGRLGYAGRSLDHAWVVADDGGGDGEGTWQVHDLAGLRSCASNRGDLEYSPLAFLDEKRMRLAGRPGALADLAPAFFLDVHLGIVSRALDGIADPAEIAAINAMNWQADMNGYDPREHCDDGALLESLALAEDRLAWSNDTTPEKTVVGAPRTVAHGLAYHAIADFYAHTNFVPAAAAFYGGLDQAKALDLAYRDAGFLAFLRSASWSNEMLWHAPKGYSCKPYPFDVGAVHCLVSGSYPQTPGHPKEGWNGRTGLPIHDNFAIDQPDSALVHQDPIVPRQHPFAFPYVWGPHFNARERLATEHLRRVAQRIQSGQANPMLGVPLTPVPDGLFLPEWKLSTGQALSAVALPRRDSQGHPMQPWGPASTPAPKARATTRVRR